MKRCLVFWAFIWLSGCSEETLQREIEFGPIQGVNASYSTLSWLGIPYTAPPVGNLRWRAPIDPEPWALLGTKAFGKPCPQVGRLEFMMELSTIGKVIGDEDCLTLNVWRPDTQEKHLPVYFYIHGGRNMMSAASQPGLGGARLASRGNMIVVTVDYRLGQLGWFYNENLTVGDVLDRSGNYGILDLIKALDWVQRNIDEFGGIPIELL